MPSWNSTVDLRDIWCTEIPFEVKRDLIAERIKRNSHLRDDEDFLPLVGKLKETRNIKEFDSVFSAIYSIADCERVWIETV